MIDFRNLLPKEDLKPKINLSKLNKILAEHEKEGLYPPLFHVLIHRQDSASEDLNIGLNFDNTNPQVCFHIATFSGYFLLYNKNTSIFSYRVSVYNDNSFMIKLPISGTATTAVSDSNKHFVSYIEVKTSILYIILALQ